MYSHFGLTNCISTLFLTYISRLNNTKLLHGFGHIEMEFGVLLSLSWKTDFCFSLYMITQTLCCFLTSVVPYAFRPRPIMILDLS